MNGQHNPPRPRRSRRGSGSDTQQGDIYLEHHIVGSVTKVSAIDANTGIEVSIMGPSSAPRQQLETTAVNKLKYVMAKQARQTNE